MNFMHKQQASCSGVDETTTIFVFKYVHYNVMVFSHNQTWLYIRLCFFLILFNFLHTHNHTKNIYIIWII
jgi:hypothetical protein